jgi:hypothetical protein
MRRAGLAGPRMCGHLKVETPGLRGAVSFSAEDVPGASSAGEGLVQAGAMAAATSPGWVGLGGHTEAEDTCAIAWLEVRHSQDHNALWMWITIRTWMM